MAELTLLGVTFALVVAGAAGLARASGLPLPVLLVPAGLAVSFVPGLPQVVLDPDVVFYGFLPPLLYSAAFFTSPYDWRRNWAPITALATGLVAATVAGTAAVAVALTGLGWTVGFVLGAVVGPTDPVSATAVLDRLGAPPQLRAVLEGESLVNDAVALVLYAAAIAAVSAGELSPGTAAVDLLVVTGGGALVGATVAIAVTHVRRRVDDVMIEVTISLLTPFLAYLAAEEASVSGVLATVVAGVILGTKAYSLLLPRARIQIYSFWQVTTFLLSSALFILVGTQFGEIIGGLEGRSLVSATSLGLAVFGVVVVIRLLWQSVAPMAVERLHARRRDGWRANALVGWAGMRGAVTLAAALAVPLDVPDRDLIIFVAFCVVLATIVVQGMTLPALVRALGLADVESARNRGTAGRIVLARAALDRLDTERATDPDEKLRLEAAYAHHTLELSHLERLQSAGAETAPSDVGEIERMLIDERRRVLRQLERDGRLGTPLVLDLEFELDLEEARLPPDDKERR